MILCSLAYMEKNDSCVGCGRFFDRTILKKRCGALRAPAPYAEIMANDVK